MRHKPSAWMRRWFKDGEVPAKALNEKNRMAWPFKFKLKEVTVTQLMGDDIPLYEAHVPPELKRMWINQPSTLQALHHLHGTNVLAHWEYDNTWRVYFLNGDVISQQVVNCLSEGWVGMNTVSHLEMQVSHDRPFKALTAEDFEPSGLPWPFHMQTKSRVIHAAPIEDGDG